MHSLEDICPASPPPKKKCKAQNINFYIDSLQSIHFKALLQFLFYSTSITENTHHTLNPFPSLATALTALR